MRVISGEKRGFRLKAVPGTKTRPTADKVKESMFNMIGPYFSKGTVLDLFAGSGSLGIEALSRGIERAIFIDHNRNAITTIKKNIAACHYEKKSEVYRNDAMRALPLLSKRGYTFSYIFLDPPYKNEKLVEVIEKIVQLDLLAQGGTIVCEHVHTVSLPKNISLVTKKKEGFYGETTVSIYVNEHK